MIIIIQYYHISLVKGLQNQADLLLLPINRGKCHWCLGVCYVLPTLSGCDVSTRVYPAVIHWLQSFTGCSHSLVAVIHWLHLAPFLRPYLERKLQRVSYF